MKKCLLMLLVLFALGCFSTDVLAFATITAPSGGDRVVFDSNVNDVKIFMNGYQIGTKRDGPFSYQFKRESETKIITFKKVGYQDESIELGRSLTGMFWGNLLIGGTVGSSTDLSTTNNGMEYSPNQYFIDMRKK